MVALSVDQEVHRVSAWRVLTISIAGVTWSGHRACGALCRRHEVSRWRRLAAAERARREQVRLARRARGCWTPARRWSSMRTVLDAGADRGAGVAAVRGGAHAGRDGRAAAPDRPVISVPSGRTGQSEAPRLQMPPLKTAVFIPSWLKLVRKAVGMLGHPELFLDHARVRWGVAGR